MKMRLLVDTNVLIDYIQDRKPFSDSALKLVMLGAFGEVELWMSSSQVTDSFYILSEGGRCSLAEDAKQALKEIRKVVRVGSVGEADIDAVLDSPWDDVEDACVHQCALKIKADAIITRNLEDFRRSSVKVFDCEGLFTYLKEEKGLEYEYLEM